ncbi:MAG: GNAT family N-acetyltransferase [Mycobacteriaceae bacterium]
MEPIEVNVGRYYLRTPRADDLVDDRPALLAMAQDPAARRFTSLGDVHDLASAGARIADHTRAWVEETRCAWAVCEPSTGTMLAEVGLTELHLAESWAALTCVSAPEHRGQGLMSTVVPALVRLAFAAPEVGGLGLRRLLWRHHLENTACAALAERCGFAPEPTDSEAPVVTTTKGASESVVLVRFS